ncbi:hypothetical protein AB0395_09785 [Streptosporangium sp. NPDC051023]|uniref:hypothetical protein n=1 Tax=Streptosporangium sp. NPDC051023 TaxID=3155410 RepID=UPI00344B0AA4
MPGQRVDEAFGRLRSNFTPEIWKVGTVDVADRFCLSEVDEKALHGLKFSAALPERLAVATLATRLADLDGAAAVLGEPVRWSIR